MYKNKMDTQTPSKLKTKLPPPFSPVGAAPQQPSPLHPLLSAARAGIREVRSAKMQRDK